MSISILLISSSLVEGTTGLYVPSLTSRRFALIMRRGFRTLFPTAAFANSEHRSAPHRTYIISGRLPMTYPFTLSTGTETRMKTYPSAVSAFTA